MTGEGGMTWEWLGRPLGVDLVNTRVRIGDTHRYSDLLVEAQQLEGWLAAERERVGAVEAGAAQARLSEFRRLRAAITVLLTAGTDTPVSLPQAVEVVNAVAAQAPVTPQLRLDNDRPRAVQHAAAKPPSTRVLAQIARSAIELLSDEDQRGRLRTCPAASCGGVYLAARTNQRWCSDACGTRARVARHRSTRQP